MARTTITLQNDLKEVTIKYPLLDVQFENSKPKTLLGRLKVVDKRGVFFGSFDVSIGIPTGYPFSFPTMEETSGKIPKILDRHIQPDGYCCVCVLQEQYIEANRGISIINFIDKYAIPFLAAQIYFEKYGYWPNGEYAHGFKGVLQYYLENFGINEIILLQDWLRMYLENRLPKRNDRCVCGEGKFKKCHLRSFERLALIGRTKISEDLDRITTI